MFLTITLFFIGFYVLVKGANFLVDGASAIARRFNISNLVIGLVIAGIGTSIPEFAISFVANLTGEPDIGLGTIIGSNTFNILFILGFTGLVFTLRLKEEWVNRDLMWNIFAVFIALSFAFWDGVVSRLEGLAMLLIFSFWLWIAVKKSNSVANEVQAPNAHPESFRELTFPIAAALIAAGLVGVVVGGNWVVAGAEIIAGSLGVSEALIGLSAVGLGTSLPEFAVTFVAAYRWQPGIAIGNVIGSNIFDFLMILGFGALVSPIEVPAALLFDAVITMLSAALLYGFMFVGEPYLLKRWQGLFMAFLYIIYLVYIFGRG